MKVKGFQVAPAELEGHLLLHPYVGDVCVVGIPDEYSGEMPLAFVVPSANALKCINGGMEGANNVKKSIEKVFDRRLFFKYTHVHSSTFSMFLNPKSHTNGSLEVSNSSTRFPKILQAKL